jgi:hypothetical protein
MEHLEALIALSPKPKSTANGNGTISLFFRDARGGKSSDRSSAGAAVDEVASADETSANCAETEARGKAADFERLAGGQAGASGMSATAVPALEGLASTRATADDDSTATTPPRGAGPSGAGLGFFPELRPWDGVGERGPAELAAASEARSAFAASVGLPPGGLGGLPTANPFQSLAAAVALAAAELADAVDAVTSPQRSKGLPLAPNLPAFLSPRKQSAASDPTGDVLATKADAEATFSWLLGALGIHSPVSRASTEAEAAEASPPRVHFGPILQPQRNDDPAAFV